MKRIESTGQDDTLPCRSSFSSHQIEAAKDILANLGQTSGNLLAGAGIDSEDWPDVLRATVESLRGTASATAKVKQRFIEAVLDHCKAINVISGWNFEGTDGRHDYRVGLPDGTDVAIEAKGCPDGNNTTIWDRPSWAHEFIVWSLCPESLQHNPGKGAWSGVGTRLAPKIVAEKQLVDAFIYWDGRCGTELRLCPKKYGVRGQLRANATTIKGEKGREDWIPPPCVFLFPKTVPRVGSNPNPKSQTYKDVKFVNALLTAFNVPEEEKAAYVHEVQIATKGTTKGAELQVEVISRCWPDGNERDHKGKWKRLKRET